MREYNGDLCEIHDLWREIQEVTDQITVLSVRRRDLEEDVKRVTALFLATH